MGAIPSKTTRVAAGARGFVLPRHLVALLFMLFALHTASAQATWLVESLIPDVLSIRVPSTTIVFGIDSSNYPPETFPAMYAATEPIDGTLPVQIFSNAQGVWSLMLQVADLHGVDGAAMLPASQVLYRVNDGVWLRADGSPQVIFTHSGPTVGWLEVRIDFALELTGVEVAGSYLVNAEVSAMQEPAF